MNKLPTILITGFLGAGKTTFLNELLTYLKTLDMSVALLINEFGKINIDKKLVASDAETIYEVNQGSIFCVCTRDQFMNALEKISNHSPSFDMAIIESTGIANTRDISEYLESFQLKDKIDVKQNFCLVDAANFHKVYQTLPAIKTQIEEASVCVINKTDLSDSIYTKDLTNKLTVLNPKAKIYMAQFGKIDFKKALDLTNSWISQNPVDTSPPQNINSITLSSEGTFDKSKIQRLLSNNSDLLLRAKGFVNTEQGPIYLEWVGQNMFSRSSAEKINRSTELVLIGYKLDEKNIKNEFEGCLVSS